MDKETLLQELSAKLQTGELKREEVMNRLHVPANQQENRAPAKEPSHFPVTKMLYVLGAVVVIIGIIIFVAQIWDDIGSVGRISVTLGLGFLFTAIGSMLLRQKPDAATMGPVFYFIGGMLIPGGALVTLSEIGAPSPSLWPVAITFGIICAFYMILNTTHKSPILTFFAIGNGTAFVYLLVEAIIDGPSYPHEDIYAYLTMAIGTSYLLLAHAFRTGWNKPLIGLLYFFGTTGFFIAAFTQVFNDGLWQAFYLLFVFGGLYVSVYLRSRIILGISTIALIVHVSYITSEYFAHSLGWPISLILLGFIFIGLGHGSLTINRKYIKG